MSYYWIIITEFIRRFVGQILIFNFTKYKKYNMYFCRGVDILRNKVQVLKKRTWSIYTFHYTAHSVPFLLIL